MGNRIALQVDLVVSEHVEIKRKGREIMQGLCRE